MKFEDFKYDINNTNEIAYTSEKLKGKMRWYNFSDNIWQTQINTLDLTKTKITLKNVKLVLFDNKDIQIFNKDFSFCLEAIKREHNYVKTLESKFSEEKCPFILCEDEETEFSTNSIGIGFYKTSITRKRRSKIVLSSLIILSPDTKVYKITDCQLEVVY